MRPEPGERMVGLRTLVRGPVCSLCRGRDGTRTEEGERGERLIASSGCRAGLDCGIRGDETSEDMGVSKRHSYPCRGSVRRGILVSRHSHGSVVLGAAIEKSLSCNFSLEQY